MPRRTDWPQIRVAVMARLIRAKFDQHPEIAAVLLGTAPIRYSDSTSPHWDERGRDWTGRLLELTRSELVIISNA